jgi:hypothetical protein
LFFVRCAGSDYGLMRDVDAAKMSALPPVWRLWLRGYRAVDDPPSPSEEDAEVEAARRLKANVERIEREDDVKRQLERENRRGHKPAAASVMTAHELWDHMGVVDSDVVGESGGGGEIEEDGGLLAGGFKTDPINDPDSPDFDPEGDIVLEAGGGAYSEFDPESFDPSMFGDGPTPPGGT